MKRTDIQKYISKRAERALRHLNKGAKYVQRLERNSYTGREQFQYRLLKEGRVLRGYGFKTFCELEEFLTVTDGGTSVSTYYRLKEEA